jgi:diphthamide biosynthesis protein 2
MFKVSYILRKRANRHNRLTIGLSRTDTATLEAKVQALAVRNEESALSTVLSSAGGEFLATRTYKGLDPRYGQDEPSIMEIGRSGIARQYEGDTEASKAGK